MLKGRQDILVFGELALFVAAWTLGIAAAVDDYRDRTNDKARNSVAANANFSGSSIPGTDADTNSGPGAMRPNFLRQPGDFE